jgi:hypothetical protein
VSLELAGFLVGTAAHAGENGFARERMDWKPGEKLTPLTPGDNALLELVLFELELIEALVSAVALRRELLTLEAKLAADEIIVAFLELHAYLSSN